MAKLYGLGVGPGDSDLITMKVVKLLEKIDVLYTPEGKKNANSFALDIAAPYLRDDLEIKQRYFPMVREKEAKQAFWEGIAQEVIADVKAGKEVGFVTLGDPMLYSTYSYILELVRDEIETETVPGIMALSAVAAAVGQPLLLDTESLAVVPATSEPEVLANALKLHDTVVIMKISPRVLDKVITVVDNAGLNDNCFIASLVSTENEVLTRKLSDLREREKLTYFTTMIVRKTIF